MRIMIRSTAFSSGSGWRGGVTLTVAVPDGFAETIRGGGSTATLLLDPDEARDLAQWLVESADGAGAAGPGLWSG